MKRSMNGRKWWPTTLVERLALMCLTFAVAVRGLEDEAVVKQATANDFIEYHVVEDETSKCTYLVLKNEDKAKYNYTHFIIGVIRNQPVLIVAKTDMEDKGDLEKCSDVIKDSNSTDGSHAYERFMNEKSIFYILSLGDIVEFVDIENTARYNSEMDTVDKTLLLQNLIWSQVAITSDSKRWSFTFKGTEKSDNDSIFFNEEGSVSLTITIHNENSIQDETPHLSVLPSSVSFKVSIEGLNVTGHQSRLLNKLNIISSNDLNPVRETLRYVSDQNAPGIFESTSVKIYLGSRPDFLAIYFVKSCYTVVKRPYFSKVNLETYTTDQVDNVEGMGKTIPGELALREGSSEPPQQAKLYNEPFIFSCGNDRDGGYKHTGFSTFTFVLTFNEELKPHTSQKGILISFSVASCLSGTTIILAFVFVRRRPTTMNNAEVEPKLSSDENKKLLGDVPPVHLN